MCMSRKVEKESLNYWKKLYISNQKIGKSCKFRLVFLGKVVFLHRKIHLHYAKEKDTTDS